jgi:hypothetical protein
MPENRNPNDFKREGRQHDISRTGQVAADAGAIDRERIARRAYERYQARGAEPGRDQEDWFEAEREMKDRE